MPSVNIDRLIWSPMSIAAFLIVSPWGLSLPARAADYPFDVQVVVYDNLPANPKFTVEAAENTELNSYAQAGLKDILEHHRIGHGHSANLVMTIAAEKIGSSGNRPAASFDQSTGQFHLSMASNERPQSEQVGRQFRISIDLYDRLSGRYLWRGQITDNQPYADPFAATKPMIEKLVNTLVSDRVTE